MSLHKTDLEMYGCNVWLEVPDKELPHASHYVHMFSRDMARLLQSHGALSVLIKRDEPRPPKDATI